VIAFLRRIRNLFNSQPPAENGLVVEGSSLAKVYGDNLSNPDALVNRANKRATNGDLEGALDDFNEAIALNPTKVTAYFNRGFLYNSLGKFEAAIHDFSAAIELLSDYDEAYFQRGNSYRQLGEWQRAIQDYSQAIGFNPYCIKAYYQRADSRAAMGDHAGALADYSQVILRVPKDANAYCQRGIFLSQTGELTKAIADFSTAIEYNPRLADAYFHRGYCLAQLGEAKRASQDFSEALLHDPNHQAAYTRAYTLGMLKEVPANLSPSPKLIPPQSLALHDDSIPVSAEHLETIAVEANTSSTTIPLAPNSLAGVFERAHHRIQYGDLEGAIADYSHIIDHDPQNSQAYYQRGKSLGALGDSAAAMADLDQAIHWARVHSLGLMRNFSGELSTTVASLKQDLKDLSYQSPLKTVTSLPATAAPNPTAASTVNTASQKVDGSSQINLPSGSIPTSSVLDQPTPGSTPAAQSLDAAIAAQSRLIEQNPLNAEAFFERGQSRALAGDLQGAIDDYSRTIRLDAENTEAYIKRARCRSALGDEAAAQEDLNQAIRHTPFGSLNRPQLQSPQTPTPQPKTLQIPQSTHYFPSIPALPAPRLAEKMDDGVSDAASLFRQENNKLPSTPPAQPACNHEGNRPDNQFCIYCGEPLSILSRDSSDVPTAAVKSPPQPQIKPTDSNQQQRLQKAKNYYDQGLTLFKAGDRQGSLQSLSVALKIFLEQRDIERYQQTLNFMQDVAHALNNTDADIEDPDDSLLL